MRQKSSESRAVNGSSATILTFPIKKTDKQMYETDKVEFRKLLREIQTRTVKISLNLSHSLKTNYRKRKSSGSPKEKLEQQAKKKTASIEHPTELRTSSDDENTGILQNETSREDQNVRQGLELNENSKKQTTSPPDSNQERLQPDQESDKKLNIEKSTDLGHQDAAEGHSIVERLVDEVKNVDNQISEKTPQSQDADAVNSIKINETDDDEECKLLFVRRAQVACSFCDLTFEDKTSLMNHFTKSHSTVTDSAPRYSKCPVCGRTFDNIINLRLHIASTHHYRIPTSKKILVSPSSVSETLVPESTHKKIGDSYGFSQSSDKRLNERKPNFVANKTGFRVNRCWSTRNNYCYGCPCCKTTALTKGRLMNHLRGNLTPDPKKFIKKSKSHVTKVQRPPRQNVFQTLSFSVGENNFFCTNCSEKIENLDNLTTHTCKEIADKLTIKFMPEHRNNNYSGITVHNKYVEYREPNTSLNLAEGIVTEIFIKEIIASGLKYVSKEETIEFESI